MFVSLILLLFVISAINFNLAQYFSSDLSCVGLVAAGFGFERCFGLGGAGGSTKIMYK